MKEFEEKETENHEELATLKEELSVKLDKWEKKEKKLKDDLSNVKK